jgi:hypothetical protein
LRAKPFGHGFAGQANVRLSLRAGEYSVRKFNIMCIKNNNIFKNNRKVINSIVKHKKVDNSKLLTIGKWLLHDNGEYSNWLGKKYYGRYLKEPINIVIIDSYSETNDMAIKKIMKECKKNGYGEEYGHSSGYSGIINDTIYKQIPNEKHMAFSNRDFFFKNNHGRIMGPALINGQYIFVAAFSTERLSIIKGFHHSFVSFNNARDDFCVRMNKGTIYKIKELINIGNIEDTDMTTTADHDGKVIVLQAEK